MQDIEYTLFKCAPFTLGNSVYIRDIMIDDVSQCYHVKNLKPGKYKRYFIGTKLDLVKVAKELINFDRQKQDLIPKALQCKDEEELIQAYLPLAKTATTLTHKYHAAIGFIVHEDHSVANILRNISNLVYAHDNNQFSYWDGAPNYIEPNGYVYVDSGHLGFQKEFTDYTNHIDPDDHSKYEAAMNKVLDDDYLQEDSFIVPLINGDGYYPVFTYYGDQDKVTAAVFIADNFINIKNRFSFELKNIENYRNLSELNLGINKNSILR